LMYALSGVGRAGATRAGYHSGKVFVSVDGVQRAHGKTTAAYKVEALGITANQGGEPNHATFQAQGWLPTTGMEAVITLGSINNLRRLFAGQVMGVQEGYQTHKSLPSYGVRAIDWTWGLGRVIVNGRYTGSASTIAETLMGFAPDGYTADCVQAGLPTVTGGITFTNQALPNALTALARRVGAYWRIDEHKRLHFFSENTFITNPQTLTENLKTLERFSLSRDLSQIITRAYVEGGGGTAMAVVVPGETFIPVTEGEWYSPTGGVVMSGPQRITYAGVDLGGTGALVGPGAAPSAPPAGAATVGGSVTSGAHDYVTTFVTAAGETIAGPASGSVTAGGASSTLIAAPSTAPTAAWGGGAGSYSAQLFEFAVTFFTPLGETTLGPGVQRTNEVPDRNMLLSDIPLGATGTTGRRIYRRNLSTGSAWTLIQTLNDNTTTTQLSDGTEPGSGAPPSSNTAYVPANTIPVSGIQTGGPLVTARRLYRRFNASGTYKLVTTIGNNSTTTFSDTVANGSLGADAPSSNTATAQQVAMSAIPVGAAAVIERNLWRTAAGQSQLKFLANLPNNSTTTYTDSIADSSLGSNVPTSDTSGLTQPEGQVASGSTSLPIAGGSGFSAGWAVIGNGQQVIRYTGVTAGALTGIPASGEGAIRGAVGYNSTVTAAPQLTGVPSSGVGAIQYQILRGDDVNLFVQRDDTGAQAALAAMLDDGTDGVVETFIQDRRLSQSEAEARGDATLALRSAPLVAVSYTSRDFNTQPGATVTVSIGAPTNASATLKVQQVVIGEFQNERGPRYRAEASNVRFSLEQLLQSFREG
jgi:hypothetical protein